MVASGLSLIFGVLGVINFAHGAFYMAGAYFAYAVYQLTSSFLLAFLGGAIGVGIVGVLFERFIISRVYGKDVLMQLDIVQDAVSDVLMQVNRVHEAVNA